MNELSTAPVLQVLKDERKLSYLNAEGMDRPLISTLGDAVLDRAAGIASRGCGPKWPNTTAMPC